MDEKEKEVFGKLSYNNFANLMLAGSGKQFPSWEELPENIKETWRNAADVAKKAAVLTDEWNML
jgi:hypothetical protein